MSICRVVLASFTTVLQVSSTQSLIKLANSGSSSMSTPRKTPTRLHEQPEATLLQADSEEADAVLQNGLKAMRHHAKSKFPKPAGFFGDFSQGESTYTYDGTLANRDENPIVNVLDGWNPPQNTPTSKSVESAVWFEETKSGGPKAAWQSFYPAMPDSTAGNQVPNGGWFQGTGNVWQQDYKPSAPMLSSEVIPASWFDNFVNQKDGFGRMKYPGYGSKNPRWYGDWQERSVNTTLTCADPNCTAKSSLQAPFNPATEDYKNCKLSVLFHPTDFDDQYSGESVEWIQLNGEEIMSNCRPMDHGGNATAWRPLIPCVDSLPIDTVMPSSGTLTIQAKIPEVVDERKYEGNLLSGVPVLTCLVQQKPKITTPAPQKVKLIPETCQFQAPLQCATRGCEAAIEMKIGRYCLDYVKHCKVNITVNQTDYDNKDDTVESIEYIKVGGQQVVSNVKPGKNPCNSAFAGNPVPQTQDLYTAVTGHSVDNVNTENAVLTIVGKISPYVDECASNGFLFDAMVNVACTGTPITPPNGANVFLEEDTTVKSQKRFLAHSV